MVAGLGWANPFWTNAPYLHPLKNRKTKGFLMFSGGIIKEHCPKMGYHKRNTVRNKNILTGDTFFQQKILYINALIKHCVTSNMKKKRNLLFQVPFLQSFGVFLSWGFTFYRTVRKGGRPAIFFISTTSISQIMMSARLRAVSSWPRTGCHCH